MGRLESFDVLDSGIENFQHAHWEEEPENTISGVSLKRLFSEGG